MPQNDKPTKRRNRGMVHPAQAPVTPRQLAAASASKRAQRAPKPRKPTVRERRQQGYMAARGGY